MWNGPGAGWAATAGHFLDGLVVDAGAGEAGMGFLIGAGADRGEGSLVVFPVEFQVVGGPGLDKQLFGFVQLLHSQVGVGAEAEVLVGVVVGALGGAND